MDIFKKYEENVEYLASTKSEQRFQNSGIKHGEIVLRNIFKYSVSNAYIFAGGLHSELCQNRDYIDEVENFVLNKSLKLNVIIKDSVTQDDVKKSTLLNKILTLKKSNSDLIDVRTFGKDLISNGKKIHFTTTSNSYRLEYDIDDKKANCCFNDEEFSSKLISLFQKIQKESKECTLEAAI